MIEEDPESPGHYHLKDEAAVRQAWYERNKLRGESEPATPLSWLDHSTRSFENTAPSASHDSGSYKLDRAGVRV